MHIYVSLLKQMAPEHLLATSAKLCAEILAAGSDGVLSVDDVTGQSVLKDALQILACKEMRVHQSRTIDSHEIDEESTDPAHSLQAAKGRVVSQIAKKNLIQNAVPIFIELKRLLETKNSPLIGTLMDCLRSLLKDYKNEFEEILVADKQLQKELIYDMKKYENAKAKSTVHEAVESAQRAGTSTGVYDRVLEKLGTAGKLGSVVAEAAAEATVRSVLKEKNRGAGPKPPLGAMSVPKLKSRTGGGVPGPGSRSANVLESLRWRQCFEFDEES